MNGLEQQYYQDWLDVYYYNVDAAENSGVVRTYGVSGLPTTILLDANGQVAHRMVGFTSESAMRNAVEHVLYR